MNDTDRLFRRFLSSLNSEEFQNPHRGLERFREAVQGEFVRECDRHRFLSLWMDTQEKAKAGRIENAAATFVRNLQSALTGGEWFGTNASDDAAQAFLREYDQRSKKPSGTGPQSLGEILGGKS